MQLCRTMMVTAIALLGLLFLAACFRYPGLLIIAGLALCGLIGKKAVPLTSHGTARWADADDLKRAGMLEGEGLPLGRIREGRSFWKALNGLLDRRLPAYDACLAFMLSMRKLQKLPRQTQTITLSKGAHVSIFAPTGVGKGVSLVIPFLLRCRESCVTVDFKGENATLTAAARRVMGQKTIILDPFNVVTRTPDTFNPLDQIKSDSTLLIDECRALANALVVRTGEEKDPYWNDSAELWITAMLVTVAKYGASPNRSLQTVRTLLTDPGKRAAIIQMLCEKTDLEGMVARLGNQLTSYKDKELGSVLSTANRFLNFLDTLAIADSTKTSTFDPAELRTGKMTVYLVLPPEHMRSQSALLRVWVGSMLRACVRAGLGEENRVHYVLDEAASLGQMDILDDAVDKFRGYGVRCQFFYQSLGQLKQCWKEGKDQTLLSNTSQIYFGVNDNQTAEYVSNRLGEKTIIVESGGNNTGGNRGETAGAQASHSTGSSWGENRNWQQIGRHLLRTDEVIGLPQRTAIIFAPGVPPIRTTLTRYYEDQCLGKAPGRRERLQMTAEIWATAVLLLATAVAIVAATI